MSFKVVIPARYASTRLPAKALADIAGKPMIQWVIAAASRSRASEVLVATDDARVADLAIDPSGRRIAVMTRADHQSGTDRIAEVANQRNWADDLIVVNVQGDEPQLPAALVDQVATLLEQDERAHIATLSTAITSLHEFMDPNVVKVTTARGGAALYFSRAPIPWHRDGAREGLQSQTSILGAQRHLGIYAYRVGALRAMTALPPSDLEVLEKLEQLRALQAGMHIVVGVASQVPGVGVDTPEDLARVRAQLM
jgi:3-deoxy-manno-octulosonate cytidylyltransferase (CMP-KDO synthetase)